MYIMCAYYTLKSGRAGVEIMWHSCVGGPTIWITWSYLRKWLPDIFSSVSRLSKGKLLEKVSALYIETVNYSKSVKLTFGSLSIACLGSVYVDVTYVTSSPWPSHFSACNIESWEGPGYEARLMQTSTDIQWWMLKSLFNNLNETYSSQNWGQSNL